LPRVLFSSTLSPPTTPPPLSLHDALPIFHLLPHSRDQLELQGRVRGRMYVACVRGRAVRRDCLTFERGGGRGRARAADGRSNPRSEEHTSELQSRENLVCRLLLEKKTKNK